MKSNRFVYITPAILQIAYFIHWILLIPKDDFSFWWRNFLNWQKRRRRQELGYKHKLFDMYEFRPFELQVCNYKSYSKSRHRGRGIHFTPKARSGHRVAANETDLFSFGGYNPDIRESCLFPELLKFNFLTQRWSKVFTSKLDKMPKESVSNALTMKDDCLALYGGTGYPFGEKRSNETYLMWPYGSQTIDKLITRGEKPEKLYGQAILVIENYLYVLGSTSGHDFTCDIHRLNLNTCTWECLYISNANIREEDPSGRYRHEIAYDEHYIYVFGGGTQTSSFDLEAIPAFSFAENKFIYIKSKPCPFGGYPEPRRFHSCIQQSTENGKVEVIIAGGYCAPDRFLDDIWKFDLATHQWHKFCQTKLPHKLFFHDASALGNGLMMIFGGVNGDSDVRTNQLLKMWVNIPKLSEICWDALTHYYPKTIYQSQEELLSTGVPRKFVERALRGRDISIVV